MTFTLKHFKNLVKNTPFWPYLYRIKLHADHLLWILRGKPAPPPHLIKQQTVKYYAQKYSLYCFIETGTYLGEMIDAVKDVFSKILSVELGADLYKKAEARFAEHNHIRILQGDSAVVLHELMKSTDEPCLFWLDAHYSEGITAKGNKESPIQQELEIIFQNSNMINHVILIDDARCFTGDFDYPAISEIQEWARDAGFGTFKVDHDIIRICR